MSYTQRLASRSLAQRVIDDLEAQRLSSLSLETILIEMSAGVDDDVSELKELSYDLSRQDEANGNVFNAATQLEELVDLTVDAFDENDTGSRTMQLSIEALLTAAGINISADAVSLSMEASASDKKENILARLITLLKEMFHNFVLSIRNYLSRMGVSTKKVIEYLEKVKLLVTGMGITAVRDKVAMGNKSFYLLDSTATLSTPKHVVHETATIYQTYAEDIHDRFATFFDAPAKVAAGRGCSVGGALSIGMYWIEIEKLDKLPFTSMMHVEVTPGPDSVAPLDGVVVKFVKKPWIATSEVPVLSITEIHDGLIPIGTALTALLHQATDFVQWTNDIAKAMALLKLKPDSSNRLPSDEYKANLKKIFSMTRTAAGIATKCWTETIPELLILISANLSYIEKSALSYPK